jgi:hypothetical protein
MTTVTPGVEPVAWMYEGPAMLEDETIIHDKKCFPKRQAYKPAGWTETPLYATPPDALQTVVEALPMAIAKALYGPNFDPFTNPEAFDFCERAATEALSLAGGDV